MVMNLKPGYYDVFTMAPLKVKSLKSLFALWHLKTQLVTIGQCTIFIGEDLYQLLTSISVCSGPSFFPLGWPTKRFPKLIKTRIDKRGYQISGFKQRAMVSV